jgi:hypothetical protein
MYMKNTVSCDVLICSVKSHYQIILTPWRTLWSNPNILANYMGVLSQKAVRITSHGWRTHTYRYIPPPQKKKWYHNNMWEMFMYRWGRNISRYCCGQRVWIHWHWCPDKWLLHARFGSRVGRVDIRYCWTSIWFSCHLCCWAGGTEEGGTAALLKSCP